MHRTDAEGYTTIAGKRYFIDEALPATPGSIVGADWMNATQEELIGVILAAGLVPAASGSLDTKDQVKKSIFESQAIGTAALTAGAVTEAKIGAEAVTTAKIKALNVTAALLATDAVETAKIKALSVTEEKIGNLAITTGKIKDLAVTTAKIGNLAVTAGKLATNAVETAKIKDLAVTKAKLAADVFQDTDSDLVAVNTRIDDITLRESTDAHYFCLTSDPNLEEGDTVSISDCISIANHIALGRCKSDGGDTRASRMVSVRSSSVSLETGALGLTSGGNVHIYFVDSDMKVRDSQFFDHAVIPVSIALKKTGGDFVQLPAMIVPYFNNDDALGDKAHHGVLWGEIEDFTAGRNDIGQMFSVSSNNVSLLQFGFELFEGVLY